MKNTALNLKVFISLVLLAAIPVWLYFVSPSLLRLPNNFSLSADIISVDNFYNAEIGAYEGKQYSSTKYGYEVANTVDDNLIIDNIFDVRTVEGEEIFSVTRQYGINSFTGEHVAELGDKPREGYLFAPRNLAEGESFVYWHVNYDAPAVMQFAGKETINGLEVYRYQADYSASRVDQTDNLSYLPGVGSIYGIRLEPTLETWIEPTTGLLIKYEDNTIAYYYDLKTDDKLYPWNNFSNQFSEESISERVQKVSQLKARSLVVESYVPFLLLVAATILILSISNIRTKIGRYITRDILTSSAGIFVTVMSIIILSIWIFDYQSLIKLSIDSNSVMNPLTAACFLLVGVYVIIRKYLHQSVCWAVGLLLIFVTLIRLIGIYDASFFQIDQLILGTRAAELGARMSLFTSVSFLLLGMAIFSGCLKRLRKLRLVEIFSLLVIVLSAVTLVGYLFVLLNITSLPFFKFTAASTALLMLVCGLAMFVHTGFNRELRLPLISNAFIFSILLVLTFSTVLLAGTVETANLEQDRRQFNSEVAEISDEIKERIAIYVNALDGARGLLSASNHVSRDEWQSYVESVSLQENYPGIQGIGYSIFLQPDELESHISEVRESGYPDYTVYPEGERDIYTSIIYLEPFDIRNQQAFGFDMFQEPNRRAAMEQARDTGLPRMSGKITLVQEIDNDVQPGFLIYLPYYGNDAEPTSLQERQELVLGYVYSPFRARDFFEGIIHSEDHSNLDYTVSDGLEANDSTLLYKSTDHQTDPANARFVVKQNIYVAGRAWTLEFHSNPSYGQSLTSQLTPIFILAIGTAISILTTSIAYTLVSSQQHANVYANKVTKDLREAMAKDEAVLLGVGEGLVATDENSKIILANKAFEKLIGWDKDSVIGKDFYEVIPMLDKNKEAVENKARLLTQALTPSGPKVVSSSDNYYVRKDGSEFAVAITVSPIVLEGKILGAVEVFRDITLEKDIDRAKTEFVSLAAHQLRTPLTAIGWYAELLGEDETKLSDHQLQFLHEIKTSKDEMTKLVSALLNVSRIELGTFAVSPEPTDLNELANSVVSELRILIEKNKQKFNFYESDLPKVPVDRNLFRIVYQNLLTNAIKYTPKEGSITLTQELKGDKILISVADTGYGIPDKEKHKIFEKLYRASNAKSKDSNGSGLGLYIVKAIIEESEGTIWFDSIESMGTTFYVEIPASGMHARKGSKMLKA